MRTTPCLLIAAALVAGLPAAATGQAAATDSADPARHWNQFRGPSGDGHSPATGVPVTFGATSLRWKTAIHDEGWSSPVIWGDQVWVTTAREDGTQVFAVAVDLATGEIVHDIKVFDVAEPQVAWDGHNTHATPTPLIEDGRIYVHFGAYGTAALDTRTGGKLWERRDLKTDHRVRPASSPVESGNALFLAYDGVDRQFAAALDKRNGKTIWLRNREIATDFAEKLRAFGVEDIEGALAAKPNDNRKAYATSTVIEHEGRRQLVSPAAEVTFAYDPETGEELWRVVHEGWGWNVASRPVYADGLVYLTQGVSRLLVAVDPGGAGDVTGTRVVWSESRGAPEIPSPIVADGVLYMVSDSGGVVTALDAATGEQVFKARLPAGGDHWASPVAAEGRIYFTGTGGTVTVIAASREFEVLAENEFDERLIASPAIVDGSIVFRSDRHLYRISN